MHVAVDSRVMALYIDLSLFLGLSYPSTGMWSRYLSYCGGAVAVLLMDVDPDIFMVSSCSFIGGSKYGLDKLGRDGLAALANTFPLNSTLLVSYLLAVWPV